MGLLKVAAGECYQKEATDKVIDHIVKAGHLSVLEHCYATFEVTCSLTVLLQMTRHRHLSFTVQSSRGSKLEGIRYSDNASINKAVLEALDAYDKLLANGVSYENAAYVLPKAVEYKLVVTGNFRAWFEYLPKRMCQRASKEHRELAHQIRNELRVLCPEVFKYCKMPCGDCKEEGCYFA
jgi:thymidylate synthase (FAD)